jgi:hypothetical protein
VLGHCEDGIWREEEESHPKLKSGVIGWRHGVKLSIWSGGGGNLQQTKEPPIELFIQSKEKTAGGG